MFLVKWTFTIPEPVLDSFHVLKAVLLTREDMFYEPY